jgi:hypothetical protein
MVNVADPNSAGFDEATHQPPPSKPRKVTGSSNGSRSQAAPVVGLSPRPWRESIPPKTQLDADDRRDGRATESPERLALQMALERHRNWLKWQHMLRNLVSYGGIVTVTAACAFLLKVAHFPALEAASIATGGSLSAACGYRVRSKIRSRRSSHDEKEARDEDKSLSSVLTSAPSVILSR